jgi:hypothetical protein
MIVNVHALTGTETSLPVTLRAALDSAPDLARAEKSAATQRAYKSDFAIFSAWCASQGLCALPADPASVAAFIAAEVVRCQIIDHRGRVAGIRYSHKLAGCSSPTDDERVRAVIRGAAGLWTRRQPRRPQRRGIRCLQWSPRTVAALPASCLASFWAARRSELVALDVSDIEECTEGLRVRIRKSKTDQEGAGAVIAACKGSIAGRLQLSAIGWSRPTRQSVGTSSERKVQERRSEATPIDVGLTNALKIRDLFFSSQLGE